MRKLRHFRCAFPSNQIRELQVQRGTISSGEGPVLTRQGLPQAKHRFVEDLFPIYKGASICGASI